MKTKIIIISLIFFVLLFSGCNNNDTKLNNVSEIIEEIEILKEKNENLEKELNELKKEIGNVEPKNTISKEQLVGTWIFDDSEIVFDENVNIYDNWIVTSDGMALHYYYKDNKLYIADDGVILEKVK